MRLVAIAKEKFLSEEFTRHFWPPPAEIYFDSKEEGYPFFKTTNGEKQEIMTMAISYLFGGTAAQNWKNADPKIPGENKRMAWVIDDHGICDQHASSYVQE